MTGKNCKILHLAALNGNFDICNFILLDSEKIDLGTTTGLTPLHNAALNGHFEVHKLLSERLEDKNPTGKPIICFQILGEKSVCGSSLPDLETC